MTNTPPVQTPQKKKHTGLLVGLIVGGGIIVMIAFTFAVVSITSLLLGKAGNVLVGSGDPRDNKGLIAKTESLAGVEKANILCSNPLPLSYQNCTFQVFVERTITEPQIKTISETLTPDVAEHLGSAPRGIVLVWSDESKNASIATPAFLNEAALNEALPLFMRALSDPAVVELSSSPRGSYVSVTLAAEPDYSTTCASGRGYVDGLEKISFVHGALPQVTFESNTYAQEETLGLCSTLLTFIDTHQDAADVISHIYVSDSKASLGFQPRTAETVRSNIREELARSLEGSTFTTQ